MNDDQHVVLCVDDEENILRSLKRSLRKEGYRLLTASGGKEGLKLLRENNVHLVISDQRMPEMSGTEFLARVKEEYPDVIRVCLTGYTEVDSITESINKGHIYKFLLKPWNDQNLQLEIRQALEQYDLIKANKMLHERVLEQNEELTRINVNLETMVQERTSELEIKNHALELSHAILEDLANAIIGVSAEGMIVLVNRGAQALSLNEKAVEVGKNISHYFPENLKEKLDDVLKTNVPQTLKNYTLSDKTCNVALTPLSGRFQGKGIVVTIN